MKEQLTKDLKIITAYLPSGKGYELLKYLHESGHTTANVYNARGSFLAGPLNNKGEPLEEQKEVLTCLVDKSKADEVFSNLHNMAEFHTPGSGFMFMENLAFASTYQMPQIQK